MAIVSFLATLQWKEKFWITKWLYLAYCSSFLNLFDLKVSSVSRIRKIRDRTIHLDPILTNTDSNQFLRFQPYWYQYQFFIPKKTYRYQYQFYTFYRFLPICILPHFLKGVSGTQSFKLNRLYLACFDPFKSLMK